MNKKQTGAMLASVVAGLVLSGNVFAKEKTVTKEQTKETQIKCMGVNSCKGQGMCKSAENSCKGSNSCKGKGLVHAKNEKECTDKKGSVVKEETKTEKTEKTEKKEEKK